jgi:hypothetical protein
MIQRLSSSSRMAIGTNLTAPNDWSTELPFRNPFVSSRPWISGGASGAWNDGRTVTVDANGWPTKLLSGQIARTLMYTFQNSIPRATGNYKVNYSGTGQLNYAQGASLTGRLASADMIKVVAGQPIEIDLVATNSKTPLHGIVIAPSDDLASTDPIFRKAFLDSLAGYQVLRFMEWQVTNGSTQVAWSDRPIPSSARWTTCIDGNGNGGGRGRGIPFEIMIQLCNTLGVAPWFCIPHRADDEYVQALAELIVAKLSPNLPVAIEFSNEVWNGIMPQSSYAASQGAVFGKVTANQATWGTTAFQWQMAWYAKRATECFKLMEKIIPADRLGRILGSQCSNPWLTQWMLGFQDTRQHVDAVAIAPYVGDAVTSATSLDNLFAQMQTSLATIISKDVPGHRVSAAGLPIVCYECGDGTPTSANNANLAGWVVKAAADPRMATLYRSFFQQLQTAGVLAAVHYLNTEQSNLPGNQPGFGAQYYLGQSPVPPKRAALTSLAAMQPQFRVFD